MSSFEISPRSRKRLAQHRHDLAKRERRSDVQLLDLPAELLEQILLFLSFKELRLVRLVCSKLRVAASSLPVDMLPQKSATLDRLEHIAATHYGVYRLCVRHETLGESAVQHMRRLSRLTTVLVDSSGPVSDPTASLRNLVELPALTDLTLLHCTPPEELALLCQLSNLRHLSLWLTQSPYDVSFLSSMPHLVCLKLHLTVLPPDVSIRLASLSCLRKLHLWTRSTPLAPIDLAALRGLQMLKLDAPLDGAMLRALRQVKNLRKLDVFAEKHALSDAEFAQVADFHQLQSLRFASCAALSDAALSSVPRLSQLTSLVLLDCRRMGPGALRFISRLPWLTRLWLSNMDVRGAVLSLRFPRLQQAFFVNVQGAADVLYSMPYLRHLSLMGERDLSANFALPHRMNLILSPTLVKIHFRYLPLTDDDMRDLLALTQLESLHVEGCWRLTTGFLPFISQISSLTRLSLWNLEQLRATPLLGDLTQLRQLRIGLCDISVSSLVHFTSLTQLRRLDLNLIEGAYQSRSSHASEHLDRLRRCLPQCDIHYEPWPL